MHAFYVHAHTRTFTEAEDKLANTTEWHVRPFTHIQVQLHHQQQTRLHINKHTHKNKNTNGGCTVEQHCILGHHSYAPPKRFLRYVPDVHAVNSNRALASVT